MRVPSIVAGVGGVLLGCLIGISDTSLGWLKSENLGELRSERTPPALTPEETLVPVPGPAGQPEPSQRVRVEVERQDTLPAESRREYGMHDSFLATNVVVLA